jgi:DNA-damage-inducible protein J
MRYNVSQLQQEVCRMAVKAMVHVRVDEKIKAQAAETLAAMGLSLSDAVRVFLTRVAAEKELPFTLRVPNTETQAAMNEAEEIARSHRARFSNSAELFESLEEKDGGH